MSIGPKTRICGILGHPVGHSLSPALHNAAFAATGLDFAYVAHDVKPEDLASAIKGAQALGYRGLSITIPHKVAAAALVDAVDPVARGIGCINTIVNEGGRLLGYNSDGLGALGALQRANADPKEKAAVLVGSGGAARAISMTLVSEAPPSRLIILGIVPSEVDQLVRDLCVLKRSEVSGLELNPQNLQAALRDADLLLQTTPIGMAPQIDASPVPAELLKPNLVVFDAVYTPRRTRLLIDALAAGARVVEGLEMFLGQALAQFRLFTGQEPPESVMRAVVEAWLAQSP